MKINWRWVRDAARDAASVVVRATMFTAVLGFVAILAAVPGAAAILAVDAVFPAAAVPFGLGSSLAATFLLVLIRLTFSPKG